VLESLESSQLSVWIRSESLWGWPFVLALHVLGTAVVVGLIFVIGLRLFGLFETIPYASLKRLFPVIWVALVLQFLTGFALWMTKATQYVTDTAFILKLALVIVGIVMTISFYATMKREAAAWDTAGATAAPGARFVAASLLVWCGVIIAGRLTAHLGALYSG
jgi:hypothetical protein